MSLITLADELLDTIEAAITVDRTAITAGRPAHSDACSAVYVWAGSVFDAEVGTQARGDIPGCVIKRAYSFNYRIDICRSLSQDGSEQTAAQQLTEATKLYDYADAVFCALADAIVAGTLFTDSDCQDIALGQIVFSEPRGDRVSAEGSLRVTWPCT